MLVGLREFQADKADIIHKYTAEEARNLQSYGELPASARINVTAVDMELDDGEEEEDAGFDFDEVNRLIISPQPFSHSPPSLFLTIDLNDFNLWVTSLYFLDCVFYSFCVHSMREKKLSVVFYIDRYFD